MAAFIKDSRWVLRAWTKVQGLRIMFQRVQAWAAYRHGHAVDVWKCIRSGITQAAKRFPKANNKCTKDLYSTDEKSIYLPYVDLNNEYGWAMLQNLPTHGLLWKKAGNLNPKKIDELVKKGKRWFLLQVDVEYPKELQENHNELQFLFEGMKIGREEKLVPNLQDKKGYAVQIKTMIKH